MATGGWPGPDLKLISGVRRIGYLLTSPRFVAEAIRRGHACLSATKIGGAFRSDRDDLTRMRGPSIIRWTKRRGVLSLHEAMVAPAGDVSSSIVGDVYCSVIEGATRSSTCAERGNGRRHARSGGVAARPGALPGSCLVHRADPAAARCRDEAMDEARQARERFSVAGSARSAYICWKSCFVSPVIMPKRNRRISPPASMDTNRSPDWRNSSWPRATSTPQREPYAAR